MSDASSRPVFRFAPSPNGALHAGHAYSVLMNERLAAESGGELLLRIEDLDRSRCKREYEDAILADLAWLGVAFSGRVQRQSDPPQAYQDALDRLRAQGLVYPCFCARGRLARASPNMRDPDGAPLYDGRCRSLSQGETAERIAHGEPASLRLDMARALERAPGALAWREFGETQSPREVVADPADWGDLVLKPKDMAASYHLAVVVDDWRQGVSDVVRGRDLFAATSAHRLLQHLLGVCPPRYRHHRLVIDSAGKKMAKSKSSSPLAALRAAGATAQAIRSALGFCDRRATSLAFSFS
jgi:glutamyl-Q tRNA(Asp) synthetase